MAAPRHAHPHAPSTHPDPIERCGIVSRSHAARPNQPNFVEKGSNKSTPTDRSFHRGGHTGSASSPGPPRVCACSSSRTTTRPRANPILTRTGKQQHALQATGWRAWPRRRRSSCWRSSSAGSRAPTSRRRRPSSSVRALGCRLWACALPGHAPSDRPTLIHSPNHPHSTCTNRPPRVGQGHAGAHHKGGVLPLPPLHRSVPRACVCVCLLCESAVRAQGAYASIPPTRSHHPTPPHPPKTPTHNHLQ